MINDKFRSKVVKRADPEAAARMPAVVKCEFEWQGWRGIWG